MHGLSVPHPPAHHDPGDPDQCEQFVPPGQHFIARPNEGHLGILAKVSRRRGLDENNDDDDSVATDDP